MGYYPDSTNAQLSSAAVVMLLLDSIFTLLCFEINAIETKHTTYVN